MQISGHPNARSRRKVIELEKQHQEITVISVEEMRHAKNVNNLSPSFQDKVHAMMKVSDRLVKFKIDSGASCDVLRAADLPPRHLRPAVTETNIVLRLYDNTPLRPIGSCRLAMKNPMTGQSHEANFIIVFFWHRQAAKDYSGVVSRRTSVGDHHAL